MPSCIDMGSKLPMQPLNLGERPGREDLMFQVTKSGLDDGNQSRAGIWYEDDAQLLVQERGRNRRATCEGTVQGVKGMETMLGGAGLVVLNCCLTSRWVDREEGHDG